MSALSRAGRSLALAFACAPVLSAGAQEGRVELPTITVEAPNKPQAARAGRPRVAARKPRPAGSRPASTPAAATTAPDGNGPNAARAAPAAVTRYQLPQRSFSVTAKDVEQTINAKDPEDAIKYLPSLFVRKRNDGDNQAVLATRSWGLNSSARTLIYYDDLLISALIGNNNSGAAPRWNLVSPEAIGRIDFLNGPFAAAYPGNSIGGVLLIGSKMPDRPFAAVKETVSVMPWQQYGTRDTYVSSQTSATAGSREGPLSWLISANYQSSAQQPLSYVTNSTIPAKTTGTYYALNKQGLPANVIGAGTLAQSEQTSANLRLTYDLTSTIQAAYSVGIWTNQQNSNPQTYLTSTVTHLPTFAGNGTFASSRYIWDQTQLSNALSLKSNTGGVFDFDLSASSYNYLQDILVNPFTVVASPGIGYSTNGKVTRNDGTNWQNADAKGIWRPTGADGAHEVSFGIHGDRYRLQNPAYASAVWFATPNTGTGQLYSDGEGETRTGALWLQDAWKIASNLKLTLGGRLESWQALDGFNLGTVTTAAGAITRTVTKVQPELGSTNFSPKASLSWDIDRAWNMTINLGESWRYPTVTELYQNVTVGGVATFANPFLAPEQDFTGEVNLERKWSEGRVRLTVFSERTNNAIISQTNLVTNPANGAQVPTTTISNVAAIAMQGGELSGEHDNVGIKGLQVFASVTYVDSRILSDPSWAGTDPLTGKPTSVVGKRVPYVPDWRAKAGVTYRPDENWAWTVAARYSGKQYSTLDNTDIIPHVYGAFDTFFVVDLKVHYNATKNFSFDAGIDNVFNQQYFLFHPFPGRTYVLAGKYTF